MAEKFSDLLIEEKGLNNLLIKLLKPYLTIVKPAGGLIFKEKFYGLTQYGKVAIALLAQKVKARSQMSESEEIRPKDVARITGIPGGTIKRSLRELRGEGLIESRQGRYWVPDRVLHKFGEFLEQGGKLKGEKPKREPQAEKIEKR